MESPLFIPAGHRARLRGEVIVAGELKQAGVEANVLAEPFEDDAFQVVIQQGPRDPAHGRERLDVAAEEALQRLVEGEAGVDGAGPGEHEHEARQDAPHPPDLDRAEVAPVDLALLRDQGVEPEVRFGSRGRADGAHVAPDLDDGARVAPVAEHGPQARGAQTRVLLEGRGDERLVRIQGAGPDLGPGVDAPIAIERAADGLMVDADGVGDGADRPVLGVEEAADLGALEQGDHRWPSVPRHRTGTER